MRSSLVQMFGAATLTLGLLAATSPLFAQRQNGMGAQPQPGQQNNQPGMPNGPMGAQNNAQTEFISHMKRNSMVETDLSKMALKNSDNDQVKNFARQVISQNRKDEMAMTSANQSNFGPNATPMFGESTPSETRKAEKQMKKLKGTQFDEMYLSQMNGYLKDDQKTLADASQNFGSTELGSTVMQLRNTNDAQAKQLTQVAQSENFKLPG